MPADASPDARTASVAAAIANVMFRPENRYFEVSDTYRDRSKSLTSAAILVGNRLASKCVMYPIPLPPARRTSHIDCTSFPTGVIAPMPVTTTRRLILLFLELRHNPVAKDPHAAGPATLPD